VIQLLNNAGASTTGKPVRLERNFMPLCIYVTGLSAGTVAIQGIVLGETEDPNSPPAGISWENCTGGTISADGCYEMRVRPTYIRAVTDASAPVSGVYVRVEV